MQDILHSMAEADVSSLIASEKNYGDSWKKRGGIGAYMMLARKMDRLAKAVESKNGDIYKLLSEDTRAEGAIDDIRDLRRYFVLVTAECLALDSGHGKYLDYLDDVTQGDAISGFSIVQVDSRSVWEKLSALLADLEEFVQSYHYDIFRMILESKRKARTVHEIRRRLMLIEAEMVAKGVVHPEVAK